MNRWERKVAIVTGASSGIGAAIAEDLVKSGVTVAGMARRVDRMKEMSERFAKYPGKFHAIRTDLSKTEEILASLKWVKDHLGPIHILVNNAGFLVEGGTFNADVNDWKTQIDTMLLAPCVLTQESIKDMISHNVDGHIVNVNSIYGHVVNHPYDFKLGLYAAIKHGISALTETTRQELIIHGKKIKISAISPGLTTTELFTLDSTKISMLMSSDISDAVMYILATPPHVQIHDLIIKPVGETI